MSQLVPILAATLVLVAGIANAAAQPGETHGTAQASARIMKELVELYKSDLYKKGIVQVELVGDNLYEWQVKLFIVDPKNPLAGDLKQLKASRKGEDHIMLRISYGDNYPSAPPFVRVVYPVLNSLYSFRGGALCMHLLTRHGWITECTIESLILVVTDHMMNGRTRVFYGPKFEARGDIYTEKAARAEYENTQKYHGWDKAPGETDVD